MTLGHAFGGRFLKASAMEDAWCSVSRLGNDLAVGRCRVEMEFGNSGLRLYGLCVYSRS